MNWDRIPGLYARTDQLLTVSITDAQWEKWGWPGGWTAWEPDTRCSSWKNPPLEKTLPFTGAQNLWLQISNSEGGAQKNGYYQDVP